MPSVVARAAELLGDGGILAVEHDGSQRNSVPALIVADGRWRDVTDHVDLAGQPRFTTARRCVPSR
jgi:release factor glutamine methyltransferase